jgi:cation transport regulator ChaC
LLRGFRLAFDKRSDSGDAVYANVHPDSAEVVWGVLYRCAPRTLDELDVYEGVAGGHYHRAMVTVEPEGAPPQEATTYVAGVQFVTKPGRPSAPYLARILAGASAHELPEDYIARIKALAGKVPLGPPRHKRAE